MGIDIIKEVISNMSSHTNLIKGKTMVKTMIFLLVVLLASNVVFACYEGYTNTYQCGTPENPQTCEEFICTTTYDQHVENQANEARDAFMDGEGEIGSLVGGAEWEPDSEGNEPTGEGGFRSDVRDSLEGKVENSLSSEHNLGSMGVDDYSGLQYDGEGTLHNAGETIHNLDNFEGNDISTTDDGFDVTTDGDTISTQQHGTFELEENSNFNIEDGHIDFYSSEGEWTNNDGDVDLLVHDEDSTVNYDVENEIARDASDVSINSRNENDDETSVYIGEDETDVTDVYVNQDLDGRDGVATNGESVNELGFEAQNTGHVETVVSSEQYEETDVAFEWDELEGDYSHKGRVEEPMTEDKRDMILEGAEDSEEILTRYVEWSIMEGDMDDRYEDGYYYHGENQIEGFEGDDAITMYNGRDSDGNLATYEVSREGVDRVNPLSEDAEYTGQLRDDGSYQIGDESIPQSFLEGDDHVGFINEAGEFISTGGTEGMDEEDDDEGVECVTDADCPPGYECIGGECVPEDDEECETDEDCPGDMVCDDGECVDCIVDEDCDEDEKCEDNVCVSTECETDDDCVDECEGTTLLVKKCDTDTNECYVFEEEEESLECIDVDEECTEDSECADKCFDDDLLITACDTSDNECYVESVEFESDACIACDDDEDCDDGDGCTEGECVDGSCQFLQEDDLTSCDDGDGYCCGGVCVTNIEGDNYHEDCKGEPSCEEGVVSYDYSNEGNVCGDNECRVCNEGFCSYDDHSLCDDHEMCSFGECVECGDQCELGEIRCMEGSDIQYQECEEHSEIENCYVWGAPQICEEGFVCDDDEGECVPEDDVECETDADCPEDECEGTTLVNYYCDEVNNECSFTYEFNSPECIEECETDEDCPQDHCVGDTFYNFTCVDGNCVSLQVEDYPECVGECEDDTDCPEDECEGTTLISHYCDVYGECTTVEIENSDRCGGECETDEDCGEYICIGTTKKDFYCSDNGCDYIIEHNSDLCKENELEVEYYDAAWNEIDNINRQKQYIMIYVYEDEDAIENINEFEIDGNLPIDTPSKEELTEGEVDGITGYYVELDLSMLSAHTDYYLNFYIEVETEDGETLYRAITEVLPDLDYLAPPEVVIG